MKVILIDDVYGLGRRGDLANVAAGYGRNYLIPKQLAVMATSSNLKMVEEQRVALAKKESKYVEEAELLAQELGQVHIIISRKAGDTGVLFGSVTSKDMEEVLTALKAEADLRRDEMLDSSSRIFASKMTEADLKEVVAFFNSPVGLRYSSNRTRALEEIYAVLEPWSTATSNRLFDLFQAEMRKRGHQL